MFHQNEQFILNLQSSILPQLQFFLLHMTLSQLCRHYVSSVGQKERLEYTWLGVHACVPLWNAHMASLVHCNAHLT